MNEGSRYLELAERIITVRGVPLTGNQIIDFAQEYGALPFESYQTIVKTLQARIAEDIVKHRTKSRFCRTGIGTYFLQKLLLDRSRLPHASRLNASYPRKKPKHPHRILTVPRKLLPEVSNITGWASASELMSAGRYDYQDEVAQNYVPVVTCVAMKWRSLFYTFDLGVHTHFEEIVGVRTIFLRKFLDEFDLDLFETDGTGATSSAVRTALPVLSPGRRSRLESGRLTSSETIQFYQVVNLVGQKKTIVSRQLNALCLACVVDLTENFDEQPETHRRLELTSTTWQSVKDSADRITDSDASDFTTISFRVRR